MRRVFYCQRHDIAVTTRCPHGIEVPFWDDHTVSIEQLREEGVRETVILDIVYAVEIDGVFKRCPCTETHHTQAA